MTASAYQPFGPAGRPGGRPAAKPRYRVSGAGRIDYQFNDAYPGVRGDPHPVVFIRAINLSSH